MSEGIVLTQYTPNNPTPSSLSEQEPAKQVPPRDSTPNGASQGHSQGQGQIKSRDSQGCDNQGYIPDTKDSVVNGDLEKPVSVKIDSDGDACGEFEDRPPPQGLAATLHTARCRATRMCTSHHSHIKWSFILLCLLVYFIYFGFALAYEFGSEPSIRLLWVTCVVVFGIILHLVWKYLHEDIILCVKPCTPFIKKHGRLLLWMVLLVIFVAVFTFVLVDVFHINKQPYNLVSLSGLVLLLLFCLLFSHSPAHVKDVVNDVIGNTSPFIRKWAGAQSNVNWRAVLWGVALQFVFALIILRWSWGYIAFEWLGDRVFEFLSHADVGAEFVFGEDFRDHFIAFVVLPVVVFFSTVISILYYLGVMQAVIQKIGWVLQSLMGTTAGESLNAAGNIFIGQSEAPLMIRPLLKNMTRSEIHAVMTGGFATIAGSVMAGYILIGVPANHLISASVMSAPAALAISKLFYPETQVSRTTAEDVKSMEKSKDRNILEAASRGACQSIVLVAAIAVNLIAFVSLLHFLNSTLTWFGHRVGWDDPPLTFELICSYLLYPLAVVMGASLENCRVVAELVGVKTFINEFVAYEALGVFINNRKHLTEHMNLNGSYSSNADDIILYNYTDTITPNQDPEFHESFVLYRGILTDRTEVISTYALCGFANFGSVGIVLGTLTAMAPSRGSDIAQVALRAMIAGNIACFTTACIAGLFYTGDLQT